MNATNLNIDIGLKKYYLPIPFQAQGGSVLVVEYTSSARIGVENEIINNGNIVYSDYLISGTGPYSLTRITSNMNSRLLINSIVMTNYYKISFNLLRSYSFFTKYQLTARISNSTVLLNTTIDFKNSKYICFTNKLERIKDNGQNFYFKNFQNCLIFSRFSYKNIVQNRTK